MCLGRLATVLGLGLVSSMRQPLQSEWRLIAIEIYQRFYCLFLALQWYRYLANSGWSLLQNLWNRSNPHGQRKLCSGHCKWTGGPQWCMLGAEMNGEGKVEPFRSSAVDFKVKRSPLTNQKRSFRIQCVGSSAGMNLFRWSSAQR